MKNIRNFGIALSLLAVIAPVYAEERVDIRQERQAERQIKVEERKEKEAERQVKAEERKEKRATRSQELLTRLTQDVNRVYENLTSVSARVSSRIDKVKAQGGDTTQSESALALAKTHLDKAKSLISGLSSVDVSSEVLGQNVSRMRASVKEVKAELRLARESLLQAMKSLPKMNKSEETNNS